MMAGWGGSVEQDERVAKLERNSHSKRKRKDGDRKIGSQERNIAPASLSF